MSKLGSDGGYLLIDHRDNPGVGLPPGTRPGGGDAPILVGNERFESATSTCSHCQRIVLLNPGRVRAREVCKKCRHYICDGCAAHMAVTLECVPFQKILDEAQEQAERDSRRILTI